MCDERKKGEKRKKEKEEIRKGGMELRGGKEGKKEGLRRKQNKQ